MDPVAGTAEHRGPLEVHARAPGKIILAGEHAVATAIDLYTNSSLLLLCPAGPAPLPCGGAGSGAVALDLRDSGLTFSWPCSRLRGALGEETSVINILSIYIWCADNGASIPGVDVETVQFPLSLDDLRFAQVYRFMGDVLGSSVEAQLHRLLGAET
uniref:Uncharacterized protein n=1 Tax=Zea mays TaxID=4577 RepID=A0A804REB0_MAIZE